MHASIPSPEFVKPYVTETLDSRSMYFSCAAVQSSMNLMRPDELVLAYTRLMMGFLLFQPAPTSLAMIGLGGGSLAKFCHRHLPQTRVAVVEINPHVIALRDAFMVPPDGARFKVHEGDGALFMRRPPKKFEVLMVDGFEVSGVPPRLCAQRFYDSCYDALHPGGVLVANFHPLHPQFDAYVNRVRTAFRDRGSVVVIHDLESTNAVLFACKGHAMVPPPTGRLRPFGLSDAAWDQLRPAFEALVQQLTTPHP